MIEIIHGKMETVLDTLPENTFDGSLCDPPYGIGFMGKAWDYRVPTAAQWGSVLRTLKPGAHLLAFGGARTYHRMVCEIEDAGFEIRDMAEWIYGTGFPKSVNLGEGMGSALKPAHEPICIARKPLIGTLAENFRTYGTGGLAIEMSRIEKAADDTNGWDNWDDPGSSNVAMSGGNTARTAAEKSLRPSVGRWPANIVLDEHAAAILDKTVGDRPGMSGGGKHRNGAKPGMFGAIDGNDSHIRSDNGGPSRFFYTAKASRAERDKGCEDMPEITGGGAKNGHPTVKPISLCRWLAGLILPPNRGVPRTLAIPFAGVGSEMIGARMAGWDRILGMEDDSEGRGYIEIARRRIQAHFPDCIP